jgi:hypothetical protein
MKHHYRHRALGYEQLERKAAPSSLLMVVPGDSSESEPVVVVSGPITTYSSLVGNCRYETDQILRFVAENATGGEGAHRPATLPTDAQCATADEMMKLIPVARTSLLVLGFYDYGSEL